MQVEIKIDGACREPRVVIFTDRMSDEVNALLQRISDEAPQVIAGFREGALEVLEPAEILRVYASAGKVFAVAERGEYQIRLRLYELEERLDRNSFVRISNSEIINLKRARGFDLSLSGTICVSMSDGTAAYVSRRYVPRIKKVLGI